MIVDGKKIAEEIVTNLAAQRAGLPPVLRLGVLMGEGDEASASFVKIKERVADKLRVVVVREMVDASATNASALRALERLIKNCAGVIVQMPLPAHIDTESLARAVPPQKDVDAINPEPHARSVRAPVAEAISEILVREGVTCLGKKAVVVGAGRLVGAPAAELLRDLEAEVKVVTEASGSLSELKDADIVVLGAGQPGLVKPEMLKEGVVLIDAGTSDVAGSLAGDAAPECAKAASVFTPVPGGVGPIAVAMIFKNLFTLAHQ